MTNVIQSLQSQMVLIRIVMLFSVVLTLAACQTHTRLMEQGSEAPIPLNHLPALKGDYFEFESGAVGRPFHVYVRYPVGYDPAADVRYPVVYILDGDSLFPILASNHLFLTYDDNLPEVIVVGIAYGSFGRDINKRGYDFSARAEDANDNQGGAPLFHRFLELELIPEVEQRYRADPSRRILFGQSRGGYMVLYSAFTKPDLFWGRIACNPVFNPGRDLFFSAAASSTVDGLGLVVTSGSRDRPHYRDDALSWFEHMQQQREMPWDLKAITIDGGTHAANSTDSYRSGMNWLFNRN